MTLFSKMLDQGQKCQAYIASLFGNAISKIQCLRSHHKALLIVGVAVLGLIGVFYATSSTLPLNYGIVFLLVVGLMFGITAKFLLNKMVGFQDQEQESEKRFRAVVEQTSDGILLIDINTKIILEANAAYCNLAGYTCQEILELTFYDLVQADRETIDQQFEHLLTKKQYAIGESQHRRKDGSLLNVEVSTNLISYSGEDEVLVIVRDITQRKQAEATIHYQAFYDLLTGLPNRKMFNDQLSLALTNVHHSQTMLAVMFLDVDRFKTINDTLGHAVGDRLLQGFAERVKTCLREKDTVSRWGGDEFTFLLPEISTSEDAAKIGQRILDTLKPAFYLEGHALHISSSIGIAIYPQDGEDAETLLRNADAALYRAKEHGRNNYRFYKPEMNAQASILLTLENRLHLALERGEFEVYYQPQVHINTGEIIGMEALVRWHHPEFGLISPAKFIPLAEENGLIVPIGEWVLEAACRQNKAWQDNGFRSLRVAVNLSPRQFQQPNIVTKVAQILEETGLSPHFLELEITESTIMQDVNFASEILHKLQGLGVHISIDDFGTGYSSLGYLKKFRFDKLKIDQSFVRDLSDNPQDTAIISAVITLGQGLNLKVVAEGVETQEQLELLRNLQSEEMQGYLFSHPLTADEATNFLHNPSMKAHVSHADNCILIR